MQPNDPRHAGGDCEVITYEALCDDRPILIAIDREMIEGYLGVSSLSAEERLAWVKQNMPMLTNCAVEKLKHTPDATGVMLTLDDLPARPD
jgi:hypothetical protein